jgi:hypothetical protein
MPVDGNSGGSAAPAALPVVHAVADLVTGARP